MNIKIIEQIMEFVKIHQQSKIRSFENFVNVFFCKNMAQSMLNLLKNPAIQTLTRHKVVFDKISICCAFSKVDKLTA